MAQKVIIVTGASHGIGLAISKYLIQASHKVVLVSRTTTELEALKAQHPSQVAYLAADLTNFENAPKVTELATKTFGRLDGLVVNHGALTPLQRVVNANIEEWKHVFDTNFFSYLALVKEAVPILRQSKGRIVFTSSGAAVKGYVSWGPYGTSKAAMNSLSQHVAVEEPDIVSVAIGPGRVDTGMQKELRDHGKGVMSDKDYAGFLDAFNDGRLNKPEWPAQVIAKVVLEGKSDLSGKYLLWDSEALAPYREGP